MQLYLLSYYKDLVEGINGMSKDIEMFMDEGSDYLEKSPTK